MTFRDYNINRAWLNWTYWLTTCIFLMLRYGLICLPKKMTFVSTWFSLILSEKYKIRRLFHETNYQYHMNIISKKPTGNRWICSSLVLRFEVGDGVCSTNWCIVEGFSVDNCSSIAELDCLSLFPFKVENKNT